MTYPKDLYKKDNGNLLHRQGADSMEEESHRNSGFMEIHELYPTEQASPVDVESVENDEPEAEQKAPAKRRTRGKSKPKPDNSADDTSVEGEG